MGDTFDPQPDVRRFLLGTPGILGLTSAEVGIGITADAGIAAIAAKGRALTALALELCDEHGLRSPTPRDADRARLPTSRSPWISRRSTPCTRRCRPARRGRPSRRRT